MMLDEAGAVKNTGGHSNMLSFRMKPG